MAASAAEHVQDSQHIHLFEGVSIDLPYIPLFGYDFQITKFMVLELLAALLAMAIFIPLCRRASKGELPRGPFWNAFESLLTFIRDDVAKPNLGEHDADAYVPFFWTMFIFIL